MRTPLLTSLLLLLLCAPARAAVPTGFTETSYSSDMLTPATGMAWAPDGSGRLFITLKDGPVRVVTMKDGVLETQSGTNALVTRVFATEPQVHTNSECGVIGIAFDPNYVVNRYVYLFVTVSATEQRIVRYIDANGTGTVTKYRTNGVDTRNLMAGGVVRSGGVTTFTTTRHGFRKGERLTLNGVGDASFNGTFYVTSSHLGPDDTTFTVAQPGLPDASSGGGSAATQGLGGSITGGTFYDATLFPPEYRGNYFFGDFNSGQLTRARLAADNSVERVDEWGTGFSSHVDMAVGPDGALYTLG